MSVLEVKGLTRLFGDLVAVDDVSFSIEKGSIFGFIGPNGAGKTTTMRIVATLDPPSAGDATIEGYSVVDAPDKVRPLLGYMPDRYGTYDDTTVGEYLDFFARAYGLHGPSRTRRVEAVMEFSGLGPLRDRLTTSLSKGMQQRVAMGRSLLNDPKLLVLDEPADGLDPRARIELRELLKALAAQGKAILISSHILTELSELCDACAIIEKGRLLAAGPVAEILSRTQPGDASAAAGRELSIQLVPAAVAGGLEAPLAACEKALLEQPDVKSVAVAGSRLKVRFVGDDASAARLLATLVSRGFPICGFEMATADLEDAFLRVTQGRLQ
ncbi:MAG: ABC transporter ATP-binding protein [Myxococcales bacterium]